MGIYLLNDEIKIYDVDYSYRRYLHSYDHRVNLKPNRRFMGVIVIVDTIQYLIPLTSRPYRNNGKRRNARTTVEIKNESGEIIAALLVNNMIPVPVNCYHLVDIPNDRDKDYLNSENIYLRKIKVKREIIRKVKSVRDSVLVHHDEFMIGFCCDFKLLEEKCLEWN